jgi:catalase
MMTGDNGGAGPNYYPNTFNGRSRSLGQVSRPRPEGKAGRQRHDHPNSDFVQAGELYSKVMSDTDRKHLVSNIVGHLVGAQKRIQYRQAALFYLPPPTTENRWPRG